MQFIFFEHVLYHRHAFHKQFNFGVQVVAQCIIICITFMYNNIVIGCMSVMLDRGFISEFLHNIIQYMVMSAAAYMLQIP